MPSKKRSPRPKKRVSKKAVKKDQSTNITLLVFIIISIFALFKIGLFGIYAANCLRFFVGDLYQVVLGVALLQSLYYLIMQKPYWPSGRIWLGGSLLTFSAFLGSSMLFFSQGNFPEPGYANQVLRIIGQDFTNQSAGTPVGAGLIGAWLYQLSFQLLSNIGVIILIVLSLLAGAIVLFKIPARDIAQKGVVQAQTQVQELQKKRGQRRDRTPLLAKKEGHDIVDYGDDPLGLHKSQSAGVPQSESVTDQMPVMPVSEPVEPEIKWNQPTSDTIGTEAEASTSQTSSAVPDFTNNTIDENYQLPSTDLLTKTKPTDQTKEYQSLTEKSRLVHDTLQSFGVEAEVTSVALGPSVTQYELKPGQGVKVNRIANLADDLALALAAKSIRIEAPIPGKPFVGIEVPNATQSVVGFRDMMEQVPNDHDHLLTVPLGRDVTGNIVFADLASMPHLLIAGSTGSGKSVGLNGIIVSLLLKAKPSEVKLMMVDPKVVELSIYNGIPHLLTPVVSDPRKAAKSLQKLVDEMENRYQLLAEFGKRNVNEYNAAVDAHNLAAKDNGQAVMHRLPYIVAIVDEFADLMSTVGSEIEVSIARLGAKARAAGIHMILATQRPDVKVINGTIKSNIPGRIAFRTASGVDSRTILDSNGAEKLLGRGDMIFAPPGKPMQRVQGAFISNQDVTNVVEFVKSQQDVEYSDSMTVTDEEIAQDATGSNQGQSEDELFQEALEFVIGEQKASTSLLQRRFRIGYNRAARLIDDLEAAGYIGPADGARPRQVNISRSNNAE
ncbi:DNA translocase FtsK [Convivina intestini]|uniref:S-DNA-T family DNA segregation ATPase FtsK/SpoIIIE n=1 Tax=Convivina intestini TaxID=1505726 RepID=A0A2U1DBY8_9LACO|nr:S-DNA-T family DNA segregation ATPase FtsK/SpoIIIE [Convivina intestini]CAH1852449.1 DNA translocase FtsK [Convivina intestini]CAH1854591.1 DNA translocase FtsK [Convivina intestini]SDC00917.1 DNA segregation ATPase FtsK/SpoIIIE, S-DNA-T family [Leuconostocaceae bacterium R-53105]